MAAARHTTKAQNTITTEVDSGAGYADVRVTGEVAATVQNGDAGVSVLVFDPADPADAVDEWTFPEADGVIDSVTNSPEGYADVRIDGAVAVTVQVNDGDVVVLPCDPTDPSDAIEQYQFPDSAAEEDEDA